MPQAPAIPPAASDDAPPGDTPSSPPAAWTDSELHDPHARADKPEKVRAMFAAIAHAYDLNNRVHSLGRDQAWRRLAVRLANLKPTDDVLDVACGTGDLTEAFARAGARRVVGVDYTPQMLDLAEQKRTRRTRPWASRITYQPGDATQLHFPDASFDVVSIAFGIRNVGEPERALAEFRRVLRPGGRLVILEFAEPKNPLLRRLNALYTRRIMPITATLLARDRSGAYRYLPASVKTFLDPESLAERVRSAGFDRLRQRSLTFGICVCTVGEVPG